MFTSILRLALVLILATAAMGQTPFEFAVVQDLVQGSPFVSVLRIQIEPASPAPGRTMLELTVRGGMLMEGESRIYPDTLEAASVAFVGSVDYRTTVPVTVIERVFGVVLDCMERFPGTGITDIGLDLVSPSDMSWLAIECPVSSIDSLTAGTLDHLGFWRSADLRELELGTASLVPLLERPLPLDPIADPLPELLPVQPPTPTSPWKSLLLPGWGQLDAGRGVGWVNLLVEAGGVALLLTGEEDLGIGVLATNHLISFIDLF